MDIQVKEDNGNLICPKHNKKVNLFILDSTMPFHEALLCSKCVKEKPGFNKSIIDVDLVKKTIKEQYQSGKNEFENVKQALIKDLKDLSHKIQDYKNKYIKEIDEVMKIIHQWIHEIKGAKDTSCKYLIQKLQELHSKPIQSDQSIQKINKVNIIKLLNQFQKLLVKDDLLSFQTPIQQLLSQSSPIKVEFEEVQLIKRSSSLKQSNPCCAIAFNQQGNIMISGFSKDIKVWQFDAGNLTERYTLEGPKLVQCLVFSKKANWFTSAHENQIFTWREQKAKWTCSQPQKHLHTAEINCLLLNDSEDEVISCSDDQQIMVWYVDCDSNSIKYLYSLEHRHIDKIWAISQSKSALVSCSSDENIILWMKGADQKWTYAHHIEVCDGYRICFIDDNSIIFQPNTISQTKIFEIRNQQLVEMGNLSINLKEAQDDMYLFPIIYNKNRQVILTKYNQYAYLIRRSEGIFKLVQEPINCIDSRNYGSMTEDGEYLVIWNSGTCEFNVHKIQYQ